MHTTVPVAEIISWGAIAAILWIYVGYPAVVAGVAFFCPRRVRGPRYTPSISIIIPAYNEAAHIAEKVRQTLALNYPPEKLQLIVVSDASTDGTDDSVRGISDDRVQLVRLDRRRGKTHAQNEAVRHATGDVLVFSDATTLFESDALLYLVCHYEDATTGAVSGVYRYRNPAQVSPTAAGCITFWNYENFIKRMQSRISTLTGCSGCIYSVRRDLYTMLPDDACSDLVEPLWIIQKGYRVVLEERALAWEDTTSSSAQEFRMRVRVVTPAIRGVVAVPDLLKPWKYTWISFQLFSHKVLRWMVPFLLIGLFCATALATHGLFYWLFRAQIVFYLIGLIAVVAPLHRLWGLLGIPLYFCTLNAAALVSVFELVRGRTFAVWETVRQRP